MAGEIDWTRVHVFVPSRGTSCFRGRMGRCLSHQVFVPSRGTSCFAVSTVLYQTISRFRPLAGYELFRQFVRALLLLRAGCFRPLAGYELFLPAWARKARTKAVFVPSRGTSCFPEELRYGAKNVKRFSSPRGVRVVSVTYHYIFAAIVFSSPRGVRVVSAKKYKKILLLKQLLL